MEIPKKELKLRDDPSVLSPPNMAQLYGCAKAINVTGYVPNALLDIQIDGIIAVSGFAGGSPAPQGATIPLPAPLNPGQKVRARQRRLGATSNWSPTPAAVVKDHTADFPTGLPRPEIFPTPLYQCGVRTGVQNLLVGCDVRVTANGGTVGSVAGASNPQGVNINPAFTANQHVRAAAKLCNDPSPFSLEQVVQPPPLPLPAPGFEAIYTGATQVVVNNLVNGARFTLSRNSVAVGTFGCWGGRCTVGVNPATTRPVCIRGYPATRLMRKPALQHPRQPTLRITAGKATAVGCLSCQSPLE